MAAIAEHVRPRSESAVDGPPGPDRTVSVVVGSAARRQLPPCVVRVCVRVPHAILVTKHVVRRLARSQAAATSRPGVGALGGVGVDGGSSPLC